MVDGEAWGASMKSTAKVGALAPLGEYAVPREVTLTITGDKDHPPGRCWPDLWLRFEIREGAAVCAEVRIVSGPNDRPIRTPDLTAWNLDKLAELAFMQHAVKREGTGWRTGTETSAKSFREVHAAVDASYRDPLTELREVARVYLDPVSRRKPTQSVWDVLGYGSRETASRKIRQARSEGLIPPVGADDAELDKAWRALTKRPLPPMTSEQTDRLVKSGQFGSPEFEAMKQTIADERRGTNDA